MAEARQRGYFGIGAEGVSKSANMGALLRTAHAFDASFCFTVGAGFDARTGRQADTADTPAHVPFWRFPDAEGLALPQACVLVGVELREDAVDLPSFRHPLSAAYVLGPERSGLSPALLARCRHVVRIPTRFALNLALAGALVLYDRLLQHGRFAERPVGSGPNGEVSIGAASGGGSARHGAPRFRRTIPAWLERERPEPAEDA
ncbi:MAG: TrmH family RNA methyltransferase [Pseudomonadota bacterium]|nr:TrmH family RNA methyltransferase [Pseudomonadota bacterium]